MVTILIGNGNGTFAPQVSYAVGSLPVWVAVGDLNADAKPDLVAANFSDQTVSVLLGNGDGTFATATNFSVGTTPSSNPYSVVIEDFDSDQKPDLATANYLNNSVSVLLGGGDGTFTFSRYYDVGERPVQIVAGDVDGDGKVDLLTANVDGNSVSMLRGNGNGQFTAATTSSVGTGPYAIALGDFNGDGNLDFATANVTSSLSIVLGEGDGTFDTMTNYPSGSNPESVAVGDFNHDGRPDLATANNGNDSASVLLNQTPSPLPSLGIQVAGGQLSLFWPSFGSGLFALEFTTNPFLTNGWRTATNPSATNVGFKTVYTNSVDIGTRFFRLRIP